MCQLWLMLPFKMSRQKDLDPMFEFFVLQWGRIHPRYCLLSRVHLFQRASPRSFNTGLVLESWWNGMHFLLLWQHWLVCLIAWFRTETAHSLLLPIQQNRSMESPDEMMRWSRILMMLYGRHISKSLWFRVCGVVWSTLLVFIVILSSDLSGMSFYTPNSEERNTRLHCYRKLERIETIKKNKSGFSVHYF